jgi:WD40 repeat protein
VRIWQTNLQHESVGEVLKIQAHEEGIACMVYLKNSDTIVTAGKDNLLKQFSMKGELISKTKSNLISQLEPGDDEFFISGDFQGYIKIWSSVTFEAISCVTAHDGKITGMSVSPDYSLIATLSNDGALALSDSSPLMVLMYAYAKHDNHHSNMYYSPKEIFLLFSETDSNVSLFNIETKKVQFSLILPTKVLSLKWSLIGDRCYVGCEDNYLRIYEINSFY